MMKKVMTAVLFIIFLGCQNSKVVMGPSYKFLEHGDNQAHTARELYDECVRTRAEVNYLKNKSRNLKGPGSDIYNKQAKIDIEYLEGKFSEANCDELLSSPRPSDKHTHEKTSITGEHSHSEDLQYNTEHHETVKSPEKEPKAVTPISFDECMQKCREYTGRTNEECFDTCLAR